MTFEDAVKLVHDLSDGLAEMVELEGDLAMVSKGTSHYKAINSKLDKTKEKVQDLLAELEWSGLETISDKFQD